MSDPQKQALEREIVGLFKNIQRIKQELASIKHPNAEQDLLGSAADQLNAIAGETADATHTIMQAAEAIDAVNQDLLQQIKFGGARPYFHTIADNVSRIYEACIFHNITGQRLAKIVRTINAIEGTLNSLVVIVGEDSIAALPADTRTLGTARDGPALAGEGLSQDAVDKLLDGSEADET